jgi:putative ABC transport system permease protein
MARDLVYAIHLLRRSPGFTLAAIATLALGIGANTTIFSVAHAVLLRPLPYADPARLVHVGDRGPGGQPGNVGYTTFVDWRAQARSFDELAVIRSW